MSRVVTSLDVGIRHMAICVLRYTVDSTEEGDSALERVSNRIVDVCNWEVTPLCQQDEKDGNFTETCQRVSRYVHSRADFFRNSFAIVVEHQMAARMRCVAAALLGAIGIVAPGVPCSFQLSARKLAAWQEEVPQDALKSYSGRKKAAILVVQKVLGLPEVLPRGRARAHVMSSSPRWDAMATFFLQSSKRDDLADAWLHNMAFAHYNFFAPTRRKRKAPVASRTDRQLDDLENKHRNEDRVEDSPGL